MQFGKRKADVVEFDGDFLRNFKEGETVVRFLDEIDDWTFYREHYTPTNKMFPCTQDPECPGCNHPSDKVSKSSRKYATSILLVKQGIVLPFKVSVTLSDRMENRSKRAGGTITDRDYVIIRTGQGLDTDYDVDSGDKYELDSSKHERYNIEEILKETFDRNAEEIIDPIEVKEEPKRASRRSTLDVMKEQAVKGQPENPPSDASDVIELSESDIRKMSFAQLAKLASEADLDITDVETKGELVALLLEKLS